MGWLHIPSDTVSCPITSDTVSKKFPKVSRKFDKKLIALLLVTQLRTGNFLRF
jgi:hypothetical protein